MSINETCKQCQKSFVIEDDDLAFYKKISPTFAGKTFYIPPPTLCPECRAQRRMVYRNERSLYSRTCDNCQKSIISMYSPNKPYKVFCHNCWMSDNFDPLAYGIETNENTNFIESYYELLSDVPRLALDELNNENSDFTNISINNKDCYMCYATMDSENCMYSRKSSQSVYCVDTEQCRKCEYCYESVNCTGCHRCQHSFFSKDCSESKSLFNCSGCHNCFGCVNLFNKSFCVFNKQYDKETYKEQIEKNKNYSLDEFWKFQADFPHKKDENQMCEDCTGDYMFGSKNCRKCYDLRNSENSKYCTDAGNGCNASMDCTSVTAISENNYECLSLTGSSNCIGINTARDSSQCLYYCSFCVSCQDCLLSVGLTHKQYCILNKQYSKEEYQKLAGRIVENLIKNNLWGKFTPVEISTFGYNETLAADYAPVLKDEARKIGAKWQDKDYGLKYDGAFYMPSKDIETYAENEAERQKLLDGILKCEVSGKPFKITPQELAFYIENEISIPRKHYDVRYRERFALRNPRRLWHRKCTNKGCNNEFETTYAPDRPERVYCENCYQKSVV